jgi:hypothetical protein
MSNMSEIKEVRMGQKIAVLAFAAALTLVWTAPAEAIDATA